MTPLETASGAARTIRLRACPEERRFCAHAPSPRLQRAVVYGELIERCGARERWLWWLLWPVLFVYALVGEIVQSSAGANQNVVMEFLGGFSFAIAGLLAWRLRPGNHLGRLMTLVCVLWFVGSYADTDVNVVPSIAVAFGALEAICIAHVALAYPGGRLSSRAERAVIVAGYCVALIASVTILLTFNPRRDLQCPCPAAPLGLFSNLPLIRFALDSTEKIAGTVVLAAVILMVRRLARTNITQRWLLGPLWIAAVIAGAVFVLRTTLSVVSISDSASGRVDDVVNAMTMLIPAAFLFGLLRSRLESSPLADLVVALGGSTSTETLQRVLARALRDPSVELAYWLPGQGGYTDAAGVAYSLPAEGGVRATTLVERDGERLAAIVHDRALLENPRLIEAATAAAALALDNERLQAELRAQIAEVRASRIRIIRAGDEARRRIERDIHDGTQQRLLATALSLRMANDALTDGADPVTRRALQDAAGETLLAVAELRDLAQGIHPAILTEQGLRGAIEDLAERAPVPVVVDVALDRYPTSIEATAYFVVSEALANVAKHAQARRATVCIRHERETLVVEVTDDGQGGAAPGSGTGLQGLSDRVAALDGQLQIHSPPGRGTCMRVELPCS